MITSCVGVENCSGGHADTDIDNGDDVTDDSNFQHW